MDIPTCRTCTAIDPNTFRQAGGKDQAKCRCGPNPSTHEYVVLDEDWCCQHPEHLNRIHPFPFPP